MMANPEIQLPPHPSDEDNSQYKVELDRAEKEKQPRDDSASSSATEDGMTGENPIVWHYLTFETPLLAPAYLAHQQQSNDRAAPPLECPNLKKYTSPFLWSEGHKSFITWISCVATALSAYTAGSYSSGIEQMTQEWHISDVAAAIGITIFTVGFGVAPMFLAPFSEINGRRPVFVIAGLLFVVFQLTCALTPSFGGMLAARFLAGCASSTFSTMVGGVVSDIYHAEDRNKAMAMFSGAALFGTGIGPLVSGFIGQNANWRIIFYLQTGTCGLLMLFIVPFFRETRGSVLLSHKAKALNRWYEALEAQGYYGFMMPTAMDPQKTVPQRIRWKVRSDEERGSILQMIQISLYRPFHLLFTEPVVFFFSLWISFAWGILYLTFSAIPLVFETHHGFSLEQSGAVFSAISIAAIISVITNIYQESWVRKTQDPKRRAFLTFPESRLYFCCIQCILLPIGCFWFGWTSFSSVPWIIPALAIGCITMGIFSIYLAVFNYLADTYHRYASSALAAQSFCRNILGGAFPLFTKQMFRKMTYQGAGSFLGGFAALLTVVPWVLAFYGPSIRARSQFAREIIGRRE